MAVNQFVARYGINSLSDIQITGSLNASAGITGSLFGTASWAVSSSCALFAITASYVETAQTASYVQLAQTASYILNAVSASYALSSSYAVSASFASQVLSASYAATASFAFAFPNQGYTFAQSSGASTWTITHGLNTLTPLVNVYDSGYNQLIPASITSTNVNVTTITFSTAQAGYAIISKGSGINSDIAVSASYAATATSASYAVSSSYSVTSSFASTVGFNFQQATPSTTWTITHNLNNQYPLVQIYDTNNLVFIPQSITGTSNNVITVTFSNAVAGRARVV
jgi:hypothetical protein